MTDLAIRALHLSKQYRIGVTRHNTLRDQIAEGVKSLFRRSSQSTPRADRFWALRDVSFEIKQGEMIGVIGLNGAGKSTLLKILSRITEPTEGRAEICGRVGSLLEVGTGFHQELTGTENIYLNGAILGMTKAEIDQKFDDIVEFSELAKFLDTPVKNYSSGMYVRLAFAVAAHLDPEILLIDEVLSVGDLAFQRKCMEQAARLREGNATVIVVSHNMFSIKAMCSRVLYISHGQLCSDGKPEDVIPLYEEDTLGRGTNFAIPRWAQGTIGSDPSLRPIHVTRMELLDEAGQQRTIFEYGERMRVRVQFETREIIENPNFVVAFVRSDGVNCCNFSTTPDGFTIPSVSEGGQIELWTPPLRLVSEMYAIHVLVWDAEFQRLHCAQIGSTFHVRHPLYSAHFGVFHESAQWSLRRGEPQTTETTTSTRVAYP